METKDRMKMYRERLKADPEKWKLHKEREKERDKKRRCKKKTEIEKSAIKLKLKRKADAERKRKSRQQKKCVAELLVSKPNADTEAYKTPQALGKALRRAKQGLPGSPRKKIAVIKKLVEQALPAIKLQRKSSEQKKTTSNDIKEKVIEFFTRDDVSRQAPGRKDVISIKTDGVRTSYQKRNMLMTIKEAFQLFVEEYPDLKIKKSKFFSLRPGYVLPVSETPHNVCLCRYHENFRFLIEAMKLSECVSEIPDNILNELCCNTDDEKCMMNLCEKCEKNIDKFLLPECNFQSKISWEQWKEIDDFVRVAIIEGSVAELLEEIAKQLPYFKTHCFVQKKQSFYFKTKKENLDDHEAILQVDFAENFTIMGQNEIQSAHWRRKQVTIFTACAYLGKKLVNCYSVISDDLSHDKYSVWLCIKKIVENIKTTYPQIKKISFFSDGCASQFKNRYTMANLCYMENDYGVSGEWIFFATSHGKGAVDGVGGTLKRKVWQEIKANRYVLHSATDFYNCARNTIQNIQLIYVSAEDTEHKKTLEKRWKQVNAINGIQSHHYFKVFDSTSLSISKTILSPNKIINILKESNPNDAVSLLNNIKIGDFVLVSLPVQRKTNTGYKHFYAEILHIEEGEITLKYMTKTGNFFVWSEIPDISTENINVVQKIVAPPKLCNNRGQFKFFV